MKSVESLDLWNNELGPEGGKNVAETLEGLENLNSLRLSCNKMGVAACRSIVQRSRTHPKLEFLDLSGNGIEDGSETASDLRRAAPHVHLFFR
mmetsp:Transcript_27490/g.72602  ORF Transcript_27490/g.72602 Transcript_27490/m.72602 type:complete len:93 (+) Transcript_27490:745-1023(+)